jgi:integrase
MDLAQRMKGLFRRGQWWWFRYTPHVGGKQVRVRLNTQDEGKAAQKALEIARKAPLEPSGQLSTEMEAYFASALADKRLSRFTVFTRRYAIGLYSTDCKVDRLAAMTGDSVERWVGMLRARKLAPTSVAAYYMHLRGFCTWLLERNKLRENPCASVRLGKLIIRGRTNFLTKGKIREVIDNAPNDEMRLILYCGFHAGLRSLEIIEARPEWFRLSNGQQRGCVKVQETPTYRPKDKEERTIPLTAEFEAFLRRYLPTLPAGAQWVLRPALTKPAKQLRRTSFARGFTLYMKAQGVTCSPHDMRRSFVSNKLIDDSSLIFKVAKWTGTDVVTIQRHYAHLLADDEDIETGV